MSILRREHRAPDTSVPTPSDSVSPEGSGPSAPTDARVPPRTWAGSTWVMACVAVLVLIALIIFVAQNSGSVEVAATLTLSLATFAAAQPAATAGCVLALILGTTRILQLRRVVRRRYREDLAAAPPAEPPQTLDASPRLPESHDSTQEGLEGSPQSPETRG